MILKYKQRILLPLLNPAPLLLIQIQLEEQPHHEHRTIDRSPNLHTHPEQTGKLEHRVRVSGLKVHQEVGGHVVVRDPGRPGFVEVLLVTFFHN